MMSRLKASIVAAVMFATPLTMNHFNDYMTSKPYQVTVVDVITGVSSGRYSSTEFIAVYELEDGYRFDERISAAASTYLKKGDKITLELRPMDVKQTNRDNIIWFFGSVFVNCAGFVLGSLFASMALSRRFNEWMNS